MADLGQELIREAKVGNKEGVGTLLEKGAPVDAEDTTGGTALMSSACRGHLDVVILLAAKGANIHHRNEINCTALLLAALCDRLPVCLFLISVGADPNDKDHSNRSALTCYGKGKRPHSAEVWQGAALLTTAREAYLDAQTRQLQRLVGINASLLFSATFSDLVFVCAGGERIHAHRCIVAASPHILTMLQGPWAENEGHVSEVAMPQSKEAVCALLRFMYTGAVDVEACVFHTMDVLDLASQHKQRDLKERCEAISSYSITVGSVGSVLVAAHLHNLAALKAKCVAFVQQHIADLSLPGLIKMANEHNIPELKEACEHGAIAALSTYNLVPYLEAALRRDLKLLVAGCISFVQENIADLSLNELIQFADEHSIPELREACERGAAAALNADNVASYLEAALSLDLATLRAGCLAFVVQSSVALVISPGFVRLATLHPLLWRELRAAAGVAEEAEARAADPARESDYDY